MKLILTAITLVISIATTNAQNVNIPDANFKSYLLGNTLINTNADRLIGKVAVCTKMINVGERGEVKIDGKFWSSRSKIYWQ